MGSSHSSGRRDSREGSLAIRPQQVVSLAGATGLQNSAARQTPAAPRLSVQQTFIVRNPINLIKSSVAARIVNERLLVSFRFDSATPLTIALFFLPQPPTQQNHSPPPCMHASQPRRFGVGMQQRFEAQLEDSPFVSDFVNALSGRGQGGQQLDGDACDLLIQLRALPAEDEPGRAAGAAEEVRQQLTYVSLTLQDAYEGRGSAADPQASGDRPSSSSSSTGAAAEQAASDPAASACRLYVLKQKVELGSRSFEVQEIFGIDGGSGASRRRQSSGSESGRNEAAAAAAPVVGGRAGSDENSSGRECVICLAEERTTAVLPCRHMCLCSQCASIMRMQTNKCPICRQVVLSLLQIKVADQPAASFPSVEGPPA